MLPDVHTWPFLTLLWTQLSSLAPRTPSTILFNLTLPHLVWSLEVLTVPPCELRSGPPLIPTSSILGMVLALRHAFRAREMLMTSGCPQAVKQSHWSVVQETAEDNLCLTYFSSRSESGDHCPPTLWLALLRDC